MKILIITEKPFKKGGIDTGFIDRLTLESYSIYRYLNNINDVQLYFDNTNFNSNTNQANKIVKDKEFPYVDHAILIKDKSFYRSPSMYIKILRKYVKGAITSININCKHTAGEDIFFYLNTNSFRLRPNRYPLGWIVDHGVLESRQDNDSIKMLIGDECHSSDLSMLKMDKSKMLKRKISEFVEKNKAMTDISARKLTAKGIKVLDQEEGSDTVSILDIYREFSQTNIFFVTNPVNDETILYELGMSNVIIIAPQNYVNPKTVDLLEIITYEKDNIPWSDIVERLNHFNIRDKLIQRGHTWEDAVYKIYYTLENFDYSTKRTNKITKSEKLSNKLRERRLNKLKKEKDLKDKKERKHIVLQSQLQSKSRIIKFK